MGKYTKRSPKFFKNIREVDGIKERKCSNCQEWFPETIEYYYMRNKSKPERGYQSECKKCSIEKSKTYVENNYEIAYKRKRRWHVEHKIITASYSREYYKNNKEERKEYVKNWIDKNPNKYKEYAKKHRRHDIFTTEWINCKNYFNNSCAYCGLPIEEHFAVRKDIEFNMDLHKEHVDDNGANDLSNCVPACGSCNSIKNIKTIDELFETEFIENFNQDKYNKIMQWVIEDHKKYIEEKPPYIITRKQNDDKKTYHYELWTVDGQRNMIECIATSEKKKGLKEHIEKYLSEIA